MDGMDWKSWSTEIIAITHRQWDLGNIYVWRLMLVCYGWFQGVLMIMPLITYKLAWQAYMRIDCIRKNEIYLVCNLQGTIPFCSNKTTYFSMYFWSELISIESECSVWTWKLHLFFLIWPPKVNIVCNGSLFAYHLCEVVYYIYKHPNPNIYIFNIQCMSGERFSCRPFSIFYRSN